jgi:hypothetical protein
MHIYFDLRRLHRYHNITQYRYGDMLIKIITIIYLYIQTWYFFLKKIMRIKTNYKVTKTRLVVNVLLQAWLIFFFFYTKKNPYALLACFKEVKKIYNSSHKID